ncbi:hypothetical protein Tco_1320203 [Tanacetum coccineum]
MTNLTKMLTKFMNTNTSFTSGSGSLPSNTVAIPKSDLKAITTRSGISYNGTQVLPPPSSLPKEVERKTEVTKDTVPPTNNGSTKDVQPPVVQVQPQVPHFKQFDPSEDPSLDHIPPLPATLPFLSSTNDYSYSDIPDIPPSPSHVLAPGQPIPHGRPYSYHLNRPVHMMTVRKRVGPLPTHCLAVRHSVDYASLDHFSSDDSSRDSSSSSSSKSVHFDVEKRVGPMPTYRLVVRHSVDYSSSASLSRKRSRSPVAFVPLSSPTLSALSYAYVDLLPSPKRIRSPETATDLEGCSEDSFEPYVPREAGLGVDFEDKSSEPFRSRGTDLEMDVDVERSDGIEIDPEVQAEIDECFAYADALRDRGIDARVEGAVEVTYETLGDLVQRFHDHTEEILVHHLEQDNRRLRDIMDVESQRVTRFRRSELHVQRELRQIRRFRFYDRMRIARLEACARRHLGYRS